MPDDWFVGFHHGLAARFWRAAGATMAADDTRLVRELLGLGQGASMVDVPCGDGRLSVRLAACGCAVTGVDLADEELERARAAAAQAGVDARFVAGDLRALPDVGPVDAVLSWGNSFGYLVPADTVRSLAGMHRMLRPGGRLVLESATVAESCLVLGVKQYAEYEFGGVRMTRTSRYRPAESRMESRYVFEDEDGTVEHAQGAHHVHTTGEVVRFLRDAGFGDVELLGADGRTAYEIGSTRLIAVATA